MAAKYGNRKSAVLVEEDEEHTGVFKQHDFTGVEVEGMRFHSHRGPCYVVVY